MIKDAQIRGSFGFCRRRHVGRILAGKPDLRTASRSQPGAQTPTNSRAPLVAFRHARIRAALVLVGNRADGRKWVSESPKGAASGWLRKMRALGSAKGGCLCVVEKVQYFGRCNSYPAKVAPAGSYRSGGGGNKAVEAFEKNTPLGGVASKQAVMSCERRQGLEKSYAGADPSDTWGRPPSLGNRRPVGIGRATSDKSQRSRRE